MGGQEGAILDLEAITGGESLIRKAMNHISPGRFTATRRLPRLKCRTCTRTCE